MIYYLTYNDLPSGIFSSQVIEVIKFLNKELNANVKLVSFISLRGYFGNRKKIKKELSDAIVLPMFPGFHRWRTNLGLLYLLTLIKKPRAIIARSVLATQLALSIKRRKRTYKVIYDGRGAISAEWHEYGVVSHPEMLTQIHELEKEVINQTDFRIAVSEQLVKLWQSEFNYQSNKHVIIPCTLNSVFEKIIVTDEAVQKARELIGLKKNDIVFIYSGSIAGWQSFELLNNFFKTTLKLSSNNKVLFLSDKDKSITELQSRFPDQVFNKKVPHIEVPNFLVSGDYGILLREQSVTNNVASPVKFAEYLACGLGVVISENLGDYSSFVINHKCGYDINNTIDKFDKDRINKIAMDNFTKRKYIFEYKALLGIINE